MTLAKGTMLGPYEVDTLLGAGGMGEVYRARDTRLGRTVAIKVLLSGLTATNERRARFEREARAISALSHPHICALYDIGRANDVEYLVMEYLEGETLADRIRRGRLPLSQVLRFGTEIAQALHAAHRAGITHRDLKPGNVMITNSGVKLLDFGLAKLAEPEQVSSSGSGASTMVSPLTGEGIVVGTVVYMAPEQLEGKAVDHRTDIFALGCILYEMATGQRPFTGASRTAIASAILSADPAPIRSLEPSTPPALERIILTALEKNPDDRWQTAQDVARQLRWLSESSTSTEPLAASEARRTNRSSFIVAAIAALLGGLLVWGVTRFASTPTPKPVAARLELVPPAGIQQVPSIDVRNFALSPDGQTLAFTGIQGGTQSIFVRPLDSIAVKKVEGSEEGSSPFWSSDGKWIGFSARGKLWKTQAAGNAAPEAVCDTLPIGAASWVGRTILFSLRGNAERGWPREILRISDQGGTPVKVTSLKPGEQWHGWPRLLPDGRHFLYLINFINSLDRQLTMASLDSPSSSVLLRSVSEATLVAADSLLYVRDGRLLMQKVDWSKGTMTGEASLIADDVAYWYPSCEAEFDGANGVIVYRTDTSTGSLVMTDRTGKARLIDNRGPFDDISLTFSPDGKRAAATVINRGTGLGDIWIYDLARGVRDRFTNEPGLAFGPVWSPDGKSIVYSTISGAEPPHLVRRALTGSVPDELMRPGSFQFAGSFSADGSTLFFRHFFWMKAEVFRLDMRTRKAEPLHVNGRDPQASPDGRWLALTWDTAGVSEVYLQSLIDKDLPRQRISTHGGQNPHWRRDSGELFYLSPQNAVMSVVPRVSGDWSDTTDTELFRAPADTLRFASSPDGQSFLFVEGSHPAADSLFHLILGWQ
ncbi:MAG: eukaryotic-like serine/threonine-protein kinase [Thermoanaerobaculia bacterium]|jgi:serine/threonine protein kinase|nr:eukaryotic-like serine/threonine-protein kinase [Thermoanaerobaculia bacterium]